MTTSTTPVPTFTITTIERRTRPGTMASLVFDRPGTPDVEGIYASIDVATGDSSKRTLRLEVSHIPTDEGWGVDAIWNGSFPVHSNGFGARYLIVKRPALEIEAALDAAAKEAGLL